MLRDLRHILWGQLHSAQCAGKIDVTQGSLLVLFSRRRLGNLSREDEILFYDLIYLLHCGFVRVIFGLRCVTVHLRK